NCPFVNPNCARQAELAHFDTAPERRVHPAEVQKTDALPDKDKSGAPVASSLIAKSGTSISEAPISCLSKRPPNPPVPGCSIVGRGQPASPKRCPGACR